MSKRAPGASWPAGSWDSRKESAPAEMVTSSSSMAVEPLLISSTQKVGSVAGGSSLNTSPGTLGPPGKFSPPGVPPTCVEAAQFSAGIFAVYGRSLDKVIPEPSAAAGQRSSSP